MKVHFGDTIAAIATPIGEGGISVIRISGPQAMAVADRVFKGGKELEGVGSHTAHFGKVIDGAGNIVDEVVATVFVGPNSYSGENTVEISCHGGILVTQRILRLLFEQGARYAEPGEFTKRAFLNGKLDLSQAEAVADLIHARSDTAYRASVLQLEGTLSDRIRQIRSKLVDSIGLIELELDFAEEDLEFVDRPKFRQSVQEVVVEINRMMESFGAGRIYREGVRVAIVGPPNAGKSSLLNALLETNRAIVTDIPGTTRDTIEESVTLSGIAFNLVDTAGLRETTDAVELEGVRRTQDEAQRSDIVMLVIDASEVAERIGKAKIGTFYESTAKSAARWVVVLNKSDLPIRTVEQVFKLAGVPMEIQHVTVSARTGAGLKELQSTLVDVAFSGSISKEDASATVTNSRHYEALSRAKESLTLSLTSLEHNESGEFVAVDLRNALDCLGEITGEVTTEEILNTIFSKFCIGK
jgi:tRNA modification GTPase